jgi:peroxiredoxin
VARLPHERSLVTKLKAKPFAFLGVSADSDREAHKTIAARESVTWRSWFDGGQRGPIATAWNIHLWPTTYVLDAKGVIRHKDLDGDDLEKAVEVLLAEADAGSSPPKPTK